MTHGTLTADIDSAGAAPAPGAPPGALAEADAAAAGQTAHRRRVERILPYLRRLATPTVPRDPGGCAAAAAEAFARWAPGQRAIVVRRGPGFRCALVLVWDERDHGGATERRTQVAVACDDGLVRVLPEGWNPRLAEPGLAARIGAALPEAGLAAGAVALGPRSRRMAEIARRSAAVLAALVEEAVRRAARPRTGAEDGQLAALRERGRAIAFLRGRIEPDSGHDRMRLWATIHGDSALARLVPAPGGNADGRTLDRLARRTAAAALRLDRPAGTLPHVLERRIAARQRRRIDGALLAFRAFLDPEPLRVLARAALWSADLYNYYAGLAAGAADPDAGARRRAAAARFPLLAGALPGDAELTRLIDRGVAPDEALATVHGWGDAVAARVAGVNWQRCGRLPFWRAPYILAAAGGMPAESIDLSGRPGGAGLVAMVEAGLAMTQLSGMPPGEWVARCLADGAPVRRPAEPVDWLVVAAVQGLLVPLAWRMLRDADPQAAVGTAQPLRAVLGRDDWEVGGFTYDPARDPPARPLPAAPIPPLVLGNRGPAALAAAGSALGAAPAAALPPPPSPVMPTLPSPSAAAEGAVAFVATPADARARGVGVLDCFRSELCAVALVGPAGGSWRAAFLVEARANGALRCRSCLWGDREAIPRWRPVLRARLAALAGPEGAPERADVARGIAGVERARQRWGVAQFAGFDPADLRAAEAAYAWLRPVLPHGAEAPTLGAWLAASGAPAILAAAIALRGG